jgi:protocatechuate 3,4-dioxygenase beta subunit
MVALVVALAAAITVTSGAQELDQSGEVASISGGVLDPDGEPVRDLTIALYWYTYDTDGSQRRRLGFGGGERTTGPDGEFEFPEVEPGFVRLYATIPGMLRASSGLVRVEPGQVLTDFELRSPGYGGSIVGTVVDEHGTPVGGAVVNFGNYANELDVVAALAGAEAGRFSTRTDADGWFGIDTIQPGKGNLSVYFWGHPRVHVPDIEIVERGEVALELVLRRALPDTWTLLGTVTDANGLGLAGAVVQVEVAGKAADGGERRESKHLTTGDLGEFVAYGLWPGATVAVHAHHPGHGIGEVEVTDEAGAYREVRVTLDPAAQLTGTVFSPDGAPLADTELDIDIARRRPEGGSASLRDVSVQTDHAGRYSLAGLLPGQWTLRVDVPPWRTYTSEPFTVPAGAAQVAHNVKLPAGGTIEGVVTAAGTLPLPGTQVLLQSERPRLSTKVAQLGEDGSFSFHGLEPGSYSLTPTAIGFWPMSVPVELADGEDITDLEVQIGVGPSVSGIVLDQESKPVPNTAIAVDLRRMDEVDRSALTRALMYAARQITMSGPDGRFTIRGVTAPTVALVASKQSLRPSGSVETFEPDQPGGSPQMRRLRVRQRLSDGTFAEAGGVVVELQGEDDVEGLEIRLVKWMPDSDLCTVRGRMVDPAAQLPAGSPVQVALSDDPLGPGRVVQERRPLSARIDADSAYEEGRFEIRNVVPGQYYLIAGAHTTFFAAAEVTLKQGQRVDLGEIAMPVAGALRGKVSDGAGQPITEGWAVAGRTADEVRTMWRDTDSPRVVRAPIRADGSYRMDSLGPGFWFVMTAGDELPGSAIKRVFINGTAEVLDFHHAYTGRIAGRVVDPAGNPVASATVRCEGEACSWTPQVRADGAGRYEIPGLPVGPYELRATRGGYLPGPSASITLTEDSPVATTDIALEPGCRIMGKLVGPNGAPIPGGNREFVLELWQGTRRAGGVFLRDDGTFVSSTVRPGTYTIHVSRRGQEQEGVIESEPISVAAGETARDVILELRLAPWRLPAPPLPVPAEPGTRRAAGG